MYYLIAVERMSPISSLFGALIRFVQIWNKKKHFYISHVGLSDGVFIVEALSEGVVRHSLAMAIESAKHEKYIRMWEVPCRDDLLADSAWQNIQGYIGKNYDWADAVRAGVDWLERWMPTWFTSKINNKYFCSELLALAFGKEIPQEQTPSDVADWHCWDWSKAKIIHES